MVMTMMGADELYRMLALRCCIEGSAKLLVPTAAATTYADLKAALIREFGNSLTPVDADRLLRARKWLKRDESMHHYVMQMQLLSQHIGTLMSEAQLVDVIVENFCLPPSHEALLHGCNTVKELKERLIRYTSKFTTPYAPPSTQMRPRSQPQQSTAATNSRPPTRVDETEMKCFNCSRTGHYQTKCPYEKRPQNVCFNCWMPGHRHTECTNAKRVQKKISDVAPPRSTTVAAHVDDDDLSIAEQIAEAGGLVADGY